MIQCARSVEIKSINKIYMNISIYYYTCVNRLSYFMPFLPILYVLPVLVKKKSKITTFSIILVSSTSISTPLFQSIHVSHAITFFFSREIIESVQIVKSLMNFLDTSFCNHQFISILFFFY